MVEAFLGECPKCHAQQKWVRTEEDKKRLEERGLAEPIGVRREITVSVNRRLFVVRCPCGGVFIHQRVLGNEDALANARLAQEYGAPVNPITGIRAPVVPRYTWKNVSFQEFITVVRHFWGRKDKETLREGLAREGVRVAPFTEAGDEARGPPPADEEPPGEAPEPRE